MTQTLTKTAYNIEILINIRINFHKLLLLINIIGY